MSENDSRSTPVQNVREGAVSGIDHEPLTRAEPSLLAGHPDYRGSDAGEQDGEEELKGQALDDALEERGLVKTGTADEKRARVAEYDADNPE